MPRRDGTGPNGQGAMTGKGFGLCTGNNVRYGRCRCNGLGYGNGFGRRSSARQGNNSVK